MTSTGFLGPAVALGSVRVLAMGIALIAVTLSYYVLSPADFGLFNLVAFFLALGSAIVAPLNRAFWAADSIENYGPAAISSAAVTAIVIALGLLFTGTNGVAYPALAGAGILYGVTKVVERYGYGRLLVAHHTKLAILPALLFAAADAGVVAAMWMASLDSLIVRLALPAVVFLLVLSLSGLRGLLAEMLRSLGKVGTHVSFVRRHLGSRMGLRVLALGGIAIFAGMGDRLLVVYFPLPTREVEAAYLLALSYAIAFQTLMSFLFDLSRTRVFRDGAWQPEARHFTLCTAALLAGLVAAGSAAYPLLTWSHVLPPVIGWPLWAGLLIRSAALMLVYMLNVDHFQRGDVLPLALPNLVVLAGGVASLALLHAGYPQLWPAIILAGTSTLVTIVLSHSFLRRVPA
ncbi:hypothetical protein [Sphingomonas sp.]|uniref:hypothetical protein n=1 Tax=Sphingomonas sp. TaxID=28214 RepID=UPI00286D73BE|nr:hypothetical protein [Sphingomonas sp.]